MGFTKVVLFLVVAAVVFYLLLSFFGRRDYRTGEAGMRERYLKLISDYWIRSEWESLNCTVQLNSSLAQSLHIVREGGRTFCPEGFIGELYGKLRKPFSCSDGDAEMIDEAVRTKGDCSFPLEKALGGEVRDYHAFSLVCVAELVNWSYVGGPCPGEPQSVVYAIVDENGNVFY